MRRAALVLPVLVLTALSGCGADPDARFADSGGGYGFPDATAGRHISLAMTSVCVEDGGHARITGVRFGGSNTPPVESFGVETASADLGGAAMTDEATPGGDATITAPCPKDGGPFDDPAAQTLVVNARVPAGRTDIQSITVAYVVDGRSRSRSVPLKVSMCPPGQTEGDCAADDGQ